MTSSEKVILITGGAKRIGAHLARYFHHKGYNIAVHYRQSKTAATALADTLNSIRNNSALTVQADFSQNSLHYSAMIDTINSVWGRLDVLLNNASSFYPTPLGQFSETNWNELINSNLKAPLFLIQAAAPLLKQQQGCIINMLDINIQKPMSQYAIYCAAKAGLANATELLAKELAPDIRVNGISPGNILWAEHETLDSVQQSATIEKIPLQQQGTPEDIAATAFFLVEQAPYITGQNINVDGGKRLV